MMARRQGKIAAALMFALMAAPGGAGVARADDGKKLEDPSYLAVGAGVYDVFHHFRTAQVRLEYRFGDRFLFVKPVVGALVTGDKSVMGYAGIRIDLYLSPRWVITPNGVVGGWSKGDGKNLGSAIEFKTGGEFAYRLDDRSRIGLAFDHISNAGIGKRNPGTESVVLFYSIPFGPLKSNRGEPGPGGIGSKGY